MDCQARPITDASRPQAATWIIALAVWGSAGPVSVRGEDIDGQAVSVFHQQVPM